MVLYEHLENEARNGIAKGDKRFYTPLLDA